MIRIISFLIVFSSVGCAYRVSLGPLKPAPESERSGATTIADDGTVTFSKERLEISVRPMADAELNRQFPGQSNRASESTNPYTFGDWVPARGEVTPQRFCVFLVKLKNYTYPKVRFHPSRARIEASNGRRYTSLSLSELKEYYYPFLTGYEGNAYSRFEERKDILQRTLYPASEFVFSGQEQQGYVVFPKLHDDVTNITLVASGIELRYDFRGASIEELEIPFLFSRSSERAGGTTGMHPPGARSTER